MEVEVVPRDDMRCVQVIVGEGKCLLGVQGHDFVMIAADRIMSQFGMIMKKDAVKLFNIDGHLVGVNGNPSDTATFTQYMTSNLELYRKRNNYGLSTKACVNFARNVITEGWKSGTPNLVNVLLGGCKDGVPVLYYMEYIGTYIQIPFATHGLAGTVSLGVLDNYYRPGMSEGEAYEMLSTCAQAINHRFAVSLPNFQVSMVNKDGIQTLPDITPFGTL